MENRFDRQHERWAHFRFAIVGPLLAAPPARGELRAAIEELVEKTWRHPVTDGPVRFGFSTIERWYQKARAARMDPVGVLWRKIRKDSGAHRAMPDVLRQALLAQHKAHQNWSYQLHADNLEVIAREEHKLVCVPSYATVLRYMKAHGLLRRRRRGPAGSPGVERAEARIESREVRSFETAYVDGLWHLDFHHGSHRVLTAEGVWQTPQCLGVLDDRSRLACHVQWYLAETAECLVHGVCQAFQKRRLPRSLMTDNGSAMVAAETTQGLARLGIVHETTLPYSPYQNAKQEVFWAQLEGRLLAMLEGVSELTLSLLNEATQAWVEMEYNRELHSEIGQAPLARYLDGPEVGRESPSSNALRLAFCAEQTRSQRRSDGTVSIESVRFEIPGRYRHFKRVTVRYASWDLSHVWLIDARGGAVLCRIYPLDKTRNADGQRRSLEPLTEPTQNAAPAPEPGIAPLLKKLMTDYAATGLPPAYLPKETASKKEKDPT